MEKLTPKNILLVDDHETFLATLADELRNCNGRGFCVLTAENGAKALSVLESAQVDLVVTDLKMPLMDGFELISHMNNRHPGVPVIVMSSLLYPESEVRLRALGISQYIEKPSLTIGGLEEMISLALPRVRNL